MKNVEKDIVARFKKLMITFFSSSQVALKTIIEKCKQKGYYAFLLFNHIRNIQSKSVYYHVLCMLLLLVNIKYKNDIASIEILLKTSDLWTYV